MGDGYCPLVSTRHTGYDESLSLSEKLFSASSEHTGNAVCVVCKSTRHTLATVSFGRRHTTCLVHTAPTLSVAMTGGSLGSSTWYPFMAMISSVNDCGVRNPATRRELKTVTIIKITLSMFPVCSSIIALIAMAMRVHPPKAAPAPSTAYVVGCATRDAPSQTERLTKRPNKCPTALPNTKFGTNNPKGNEHPMTNRGKK